MRSLAYDRLSIEVERARGDQRQGCLARSRVMSADVITHWWLGYLVFVCLISDWLGLFVSSSVRALKYSSLLVGMSACSRVTNSNLTQTQNEMRKLLNPHRFSQPN